MAESTEKKVPDAEWKEATSSFWKPEKAGDELIGVFKGLEETQNGDAAIIDTPDGKVLVGLTVALSKLKGLDGKEVKLVYKGEAKSEKGRTYSDISVFFK